MRVVLITGHAPDSPRKTGFHFWAGILTKQGVDVDWITVGFSRISMFRKNARHYSLPYNRWIRLSDHLQKFVWCPPFHPLNLYSDFLNRAFSPFFALYGKMLPTRVKAVIQSADLYIIENGAGLMLVPALAKLSPQAKFIYTVSDRLKTLNFHPVIVAAETAVLPYFSLIRVPAEVMKNDFPANAPVQYIPQGLDKSVFDVKRPSPYQGDKNVISIGDMLFDAKTIETLATHFPDWSFHLFGRKAHLGKSFPNVVEHGEQPFDTLVAYIQNATIGLAPYLPAADADYLSQSSLKMQQYTFCQIPIVGPQFAATGRDHVLAYDNLDEKSVVAAFEKAIAYDRTAIDKSGVLGWEDVIARMMSVLGPLENRP